MKNVRALQPSTRLPKHGARFASDSRSHDAIRTFEGRGGVVGCPGARFS